MIDVQGLSKVYRSPKKAEGLGGSLRSLFHRETTEVRAVDDISFHIGAGETVGFLGPNGAGKTTTLKMLSGLLVPTGGLVTVAGFRPSERSPGLLRRLTLVMGQKQQLLWDLPATESFALNKALFGIDEPSFKRTRDELVSLLDLEPVLARPVRNLSLGERMKCELAAALIHRPDVLFLDEPTIGLDVTMQAAVRSFVGRWARESGATIILTSHYMDDIAALCPRVIVIDGGRIKYDGGLKELERRYAAGRRVVVRTAEPVSTELLASLSPLAPESPDLLLTLVAVIPSEDVQALVARALATLPVVELNVESPPLDETLRRLFGEKSP